MDITELVKENEKLKTEIIELKEQLKRLIQQIVS